MKRIDQFRSRVGIFLVIAVLWLIPASMHAQGARLDLSNLEKLSAKASEVSDVALDGPLLQLATASMKLASKEDSDAGQAVGFLKDITGVYVKSFQFAQPGQYSQADVDYILKQLTTRGWNRVVENRNKTSGEIDEVYLMKDGDNVLGLAVISAEARELNVVNIVGRVDLVKLSALAGNLGIPEALKSVQDGPQAAKNDKTGTGGSGGQSPSSQVKPAAPAGSLR